MTANATTSNTTGNSFLIGIFSANTIAVVDALRGGTVSTPAELTISSNVEVTGDLTTLTDVVITGNVSTLDVTGDISGDNITASSNVSGQILISSGNTEVGTNLTVGSNTTIDGHTQANTLDVDGVLGLQSLVDIDVSNTGDLGTGTVSPKLIYRFPKATYRSAKLIIQTENSTDTQTQEAVVTHDGGSNAYIAVYGTVTSANNGNDELGEISAVVTGANVDIRIVQNNDNSQCITIAQLIT